MKIEDDLNPAFRIEQFARGKLDSFVGTIGENDEYKDPIYSGVRSTTHQIASDYGRRFLIELLQNAYDAHPIDTQSGEITIYFAPNEDSYGVLYVANRGIGFNWSNVKALSNVGLSDKPAGENIGNKGLGFRSVLFISDNPQIYSRIGVGPAELFDGYCFRFTRPNDFEELIKNPAHCELAKKDIPDFHIPLPLSLNHQSDRIISFARQGFVTVICLPLRDEVKRQVVYEEIEVLRNSPAPIILFLQKINTLNVIVEEAPEKSFILVRESTDLNIDSSIDKDYKFSMVSLGNYQKYFIAWHWIPENQVKQAINLSINQKELHPSWNDWQGVGELAVAVRLDNATITPLLYTFLPMGKEAESPFYGFLHAAFYPKGDRTSLHGDIPINALYVTEAALLCALTILAVRCVMDKPDPPFTKEEAMKIILDLLSWKQCQGVETKDKQPFPILMLDAFSKLGHNLLEIDILPTLIRKSGATWASPIEVWRWNRADLRAFGPDVLVERADIPIIFPDAGEERLDRLAAFFKKSNDLYFKPNNENLAEVIEKVANYLLKTKASLDKWREFYQELKSISERCYSLLKNKKIVFCMGDLLLPAMQGAVGSEDDDLPSNPIPEKRRRSRSGTIGVAIFSPPARGREEVLQVPERFRKSFAFLSDKLDWHSDLNAAREFLEDKKLIERYDGQELINQVSKILRHEKSKKIRKTALAWGFRLYQSTLHAGRALSFKEARLFVPTLTGEWIEAKEALFSKNWPEKTLGPLIDEFLNLTAGRSVELQGLRRRLIALPNDSPFSTKNVHAWVDFLKELGVHSGLEPIQRETRNFKISGWDLSAKKICQRLGIGDETLKYWQKEIQETGGKQVYQSSEHELNGNIWYLPGQDQHEHFSDEARLLYAQLILRWIESAEPEYLKFIFFPPTAKYAARFHWPTPLTAFLRQAPWFPIEISEGLQAKLKFQPPSEIWLPEDIDGNLPPFMPQFPRKIRQFSSREIVAERLIEWCTVKVFNRAVTLSNQMDLLGQLYAASNMGYHTSSFIKIYYKTLRRLAEMGTDWKGDRPNYLIVRHMGKHITLSLQQSETDQSNSIESSEEYLDKEIYFQDTDESLKANLIEKLGFPILGEEGMGIPELVSLLKSLLKDRFRAISEVPFLLLIDGTNVEAVPNDDNFLVNICPWMPTIVCLAMESLTGTAAQSLPADRTKILERLDRILVRLATKVEFEVNGRTIQLPERHHGAVAFGDEDQPIVIIVTESGIFDWDSLTRAATPICQHLRQADLAQAIRTVCRSLEKYQESISGPVILDMRLREICPELDIEFSAASKSLELLGSNIHRLIKWLRPVIHFLKGIEGEKKFSSDAVQVTTVPELTKALASYFEGTPYSVEKVLNVCQRTINFGNLRDELNIPFANFNLSLIAVGEEPEKHEDAHKDAVKSYIFENRDRIMDSLRLKFQESFEKGQSLSQYCKLRANINDIDPKKDWLLKYPVPDQNLIESLINEWLISQGAQAIGAKIGLLPCSEVRRKNKTLINRFVQNSCNIVRAWSLKNNVNIPPEWNDIPTAREQIFNCLDKLGVLDFKPLDKADTIFWLFEANLWPVGMPSSIMLADLSLTGDDLDVERKREKEARLKREKEERSIEFNGRIIDPKDVEFDTLITEIEEKLSSEIISTKLGVLTSLKLTKGNPALQGGGGGGGGGSGRPRKIHQDKSDLIGFLGECAVYHWLKKQFTQQNIDNAWVSSYKSRILPEIGNDSLGYDFQIRYRNQQWYLEVKSSLWDPREFELGETEVSFANNCLRKKGSEYRIIYLSNVQNSSAMRLEVLPNPFSDDGKGLRRVGQGLRYRF